MAPHTYNEFYSLYFATQRLKIKTLFECGIGTTNPQINSSMGPKVVPGASLRTWRDFFPNASIVGADIDFLCQFSEHRISTFVMDQTRSSSIYQTLGHYPREYFDVIIDDGLHTFEAGLSLFKNAIPWLQKEGTYVIEDVTLKNLLRFKDFFETEDNPFFEVYFVIMERFPNDRGDNNLIVIHKT